MMIEALLMATPFVVYALTGLVRRYALSTRLLDIPNARSSHQIPTPRGGGIAMVAVALALLPIFWIEAGLPPGPGIALTAGAGLVAAIGWMDDRRPLSARWRLLVHLTSASLLVASMSGHPQLPLPGLMLDWNVFAYVVLALGVAWLLNLFNFMDGIDGIAATEAICITGGAALLFWVVGETGWAHICALMACAASGFLAWNWPPAKIFMGDVASGFLGFIIAGLALVTSTTTDITLWPWLIMLGAFALDATMTLFRRAIRGQPVHEAHRTHAYQHAARRLGSHRSVTLGVLVINLAWLAPMALAAVIWPEWGLALTLVAWLPLAVLCLYYRAGMPE